MGKRICALLLVLMLLVGCGNQEPEPATEMPTQPVTEAPVTETAATEETEAPGPVRVACVGDSITYGHGISSRSENSYPAQLGSLLGEGYQVENFGSPGSTVQTDTDQPFRENALYQQSLEYDADIVVLMMGTNDSKSYNWKDEVTFREDLETLLDSYDDASKVYLCTPASAFFLWGNQGPETGFDIRPAQVDSIAEIVRQVAEERNLPLIDIHSLTASYPQWFREDGVHPDKAGARAIAQAVYEMLMENQ